MSALSFIISKQLVAQGVPYYCMRCRTHLFDLNGDVLIMWMGEGYPPKEVPLNMFWVSHRCRGCKKDYNIYFQA
jgi:hypothetical protein